MNPVVKKHLSPCCQASIGGSLGDGVLIGSCGECGKAVARCNPRTGVAEWLDGKSPWELEDDLRPMEAEAG